MTWKLLEEQQPELARFGEERLHGKVAYLATVRKDGSPRVHPMTPIIADGHLFVFMEPTSPKGHDLKRDNRYAIHCGVTDDSGQSGEFLVTGHGRLVEDKELRDLAVKSATYSPAERYILFEFEIDSAVSTVYPEDKPVRLIWKKQERLK